MKILLGQLNANGDCLYATTLARQIKQDYPGCELTWAISSQCSHILKENPYVDKTWLFRTNSLDEREAAWCALEDLVLREQTGPRPFDRFFLPQISPANFRNYDGTIRPSLLRAYPNKISVPIDSFIRLTEYEKEAVDKFVRSQGIDKFQHRILMECSSESGQSYVTPAFALELAAMVTKQLADCCFILSTHENIQHDKLKIFSAKELSMRQNAALTNYCTLFTGCGSGLTVVATSSASKPLPNIQILNTSTSVYASFYHDFLYFNKPADRFIEMGDASVEQVATAIITCCRDGLRKARENHHRPLPLTFNFYCKLIEHFLLKKGKFKDALESMAATVGRYGWNEALEYFGRKRILPYLHLDPLMTDTRQRQQTDKILATFAQYDPTFKRSK